MKSPAAAVFTSALFVTSSAAEAALALATAANVTSPLPVRALTDAEDSYPILNSWTGFKNILLPGNEFATLQTLNIEQCMDSCNGSVDCKAWSYTTDSGLCSLKGGYSGAVYSASTFSGVRFSSNERLGSRYLMVENSNIPGNDVNNRPGRSYLDCFDADVHTFTWSDWNGGTCWFKSDRPEYQYALNAYTGLRIA